MTRPRKPPRYTVIPHPDATADVAALATYGLDVVAAAMAIADDLAHGRVIGKELGDRQVSGNLSGFARVNFDVPGQRPQRFRLIYRQVDLATLEIVAIGPRDEHAIYRAAAQRLRSEHRRRQHRAVLVGAVVALPGILLRLSVPPSCGGLVSGRVFRAALAPTQVLRTVESLAMSPTSPTMCPST